MTYDINIEPIHPNKKNIAQKQQMVNMSRFCCISFIPNRGTHWITKILVDRGKSEQPSRFNEHCSPAPETICLRWPSNRPRCSSGVQDGRGELALNPQHETMRHQHTATKKKNAIPARISFTATPALGPCRTASLQRKRPRTGLPPRRPRSSDELLLPGSWSPQ